MISIIKQKKEWDTFLQQVDEYDFYHTFDYNELSKNKNDTSILITYKANSILIGLPLIIRTIEGTKHNDITSVYGYAGPISKNIPEDFDNSEFIKQLNELFINKKIVSVFSRLNPFISNQKSILKNLGECQYIGKIVVIDLTNDITIQRQAYQKRIKSQINKARRHCNIIKAKTKKEIYTFIDIYYQNMDRVNAAKSYYFKRDYFLKFIESKNINTDLLLVKLKDSNEMIAGAMFIKTNNIVQYHLSGTKAEHLKIAPLKLLLDEMRVLASAENYKYFNLGGGLGSENDSLLRFKMSFSKTLIDFSAWKYIVDNKRYEELSIKNGKEKNNFFPAYRSQDY